MFILLMRGIASVSFSLGCSCTDDVEFDRMALGSLDLNVTIKRTAVHKPTTNILREADDVKF